MWWLHITLECDFERQRGHITGAIPRMSPDGRTINPTYIYFRVQFDLGRVEEPGYLREIRDQVAREVDGTCLLYESGNPRRLPTATFQRLWALRPDFQRILDQERAYYAA